MSQYETLGEDVFWRYGWDQHLMSFYLQKHDLTIENEDDRIVVWLGATPDTKMYEVEDLAKAANKHGLKIPYPRRVQLFGDKDEGR